MSKPGPIAIFGGMGYLGQALYRHLVSKKIDSWVIGRQNAKEAILPEDSHYRSSQPSLEQAVSGAGTVFHFASVTTPAVGEMKPLLDLENVALTLSLAEACEKARVRHLIFASSGGAVYGELSQPASEDFPTRPLSSYGIAKLASEQYLSNFAQRSHVHVTVLRMSNVYGGRQIKKGEQGVVSYLYHQIMSGQPIHLFGDTVRDYLFIDDVINAFEQTIHQHPTRYQILNISTSIGTRLSKLTSLICDLMGKKAKIIIEQRRSCDVTYNVLKNNRARSILKWRPAYSLRAGLAKYLNGQ